ncbi:hypothetical protein QJS10_CPA02g00584 [Acorus calamus]|uniref:Uncharacterized protein n=1 Tax=Acorus calamus TaxID=4465 RepID=A0AAV9FA32_ACOCL|nr:hypothetical protein QJS10_CPA02g00584 [Acorus calamus]
MRVAILLLSFPLPMENNSPIHICILIYMGKCYAQSFLCVYVCVYIYSFMAGQKLWMV